MFINFTMAQTIWRIHKERGIMKSYRVILKLNMVVLPILILSLFPQFVAAQGNLVVNGGFDTSAAGWTINPGSSFYNSKNGNPSGDVVLEGLTGTASQTINSLNPGIIYNVSGDYQDIDGGSLANYSFGVALNGVYFFEAIAPTNSNWYSFNFEYTAVSSSAVLSLSQINGMGITYSIDNISMQAVPEPSSIALIFLGGGVLIYVRTRNKRHSA
jgi:hypothetical protein